MTLPTGQAARAVELRADEDGVTVLVDGHPQSHVCLRDPGLLAFEYVQHLAFVLAAVRPEAPAPLRVTHVGGAGLTLPRWVQHTRPGSTQIVLEPDAELTATVRAALPLPRGHRIRVRAQGGAEGLGALRDHSADAIILDAYRDGQVPPELTTREWFGEAARVLAPGGVLAANLADEPGLRYVARVLAGIGSAGAGRAFGPPVLVAATEVLKGRRFGNVVVAAVTGPAAGPVASPVPGPAAGPVAGPVASPVSGPVANPQDALDLGALRRAVAGSVWPTGLWSGARLSRMTSAATPFTGSQRSASPPPPEPGRWRVR